MMSQNANVHENISVNDTANSSDFYSALTCDKPCVQLYTIVPVGCVQFTSPDVKVSVQQGDTST